MIDPIPQPEPSTVPVEGGKDSRGWAVAAHLSPWVAGFIGPLIVWLAKKEDPYVEAHAREALNFQLSLLIYIFGWLIVSTIIVVSFAALMAAGIVVGLIIFGLGFLGFMYLGFVPPIVGAIRASNGNTYRYPVSIRFISAPPR